MSFNFDGKLFQIFTPPSDTNLIHLYSVALTIEIVALIPVYIKKI